MSVTALVFATLFLAIAVLCFTRHPVFGLYLYVAVFYIHPPSRWWAAGLPDLRWSLLAATVTCVALLVQKERQTTSVWTKGPALLFMIYVAYMWIQAPWAVYPEEHWIGLFIFTKYLVVIYMIHACLDTRERLAGFLLINALGCLYLGYLGWTVGGGGRLDGVGGPGIDDSSTLAMQLATGTFAAAAYYFFATGWRRYISVLVVPFALNGLVMTGSRGGFLALIAGGLTFFFMRPAKTLRLTLPYAVAGVGLFMFMANAVFFERMGTISTAVDDPHNIDNSAATRLVVFQAQWHMALDYPLGAGHAATTELSYRYIPVEHHSGQSGRSSHNTFMSALVDQGFLGLAAWIAIAVLTWSRLKAMRKFSNDQGDSGLAWLSAGTTAMLMTVLVAGLFAPLIRQEVYVWILGIACCLDIPQLRAGSRVAPFAATARINSQSRQHTC